MNEHAEGAPAPAPAPEPQSDPTATVRSRPSLTSQVRRRRADQAFFLRLRDAIQQNHRALERHGT
jgi:hypothetical protein